MSFRIHFSELAKQDALDIFDYYEDVQSGLGNRFRKELTATTLFLRNDPQAIQAKYSNVQVIFLKVFPYGIHYTIKEDEVQILAVFHTSRKPRA